ncbi:MAG: hypothetical protein CME70_20015 [Halobacteriovorax sp.]|nr:hypothetical protein [Halobacteriovorax sp.]|tara:strand:+ start:70818 stop:71972 length:1155 start_codon:yes stop_codon:yes gene_type:complete
MNGYPFYLTWSKQKGGLTYPLDSVDDHFIYSNKEKKLDLSSISYQASFGLRPNFIEKAISDQLNNFSIVAPKAIFDLKEKVTKDLLKLIDLDGGKIFYTVSGAESVENALKMARIYTGKKKVLARKPSYHGGTLGAVSVTGDWRNQNVDTLDQWTIRIPEPEDDLDLSQTSKIFETNNDLAAIILETVPGNNGVLIPTKEWLQGIQKLCHKHNVLLILDEVICGFYRLGTPFGFQSFDVKPDMITMAKGITGGVIPFGAVWTNDKIHEHFNDKILSCGLTNYAHPLGLAALEAVLAHIEQASFKDHLASLLSEFKKDLEGLSQKTRVIGALAAIDLKDAPSWNTFWDEGISLIAQKDRIILAPHLNLPIDIWKESFNKLEKLLV